jgi:hypothetical protein
MTAAAHRRGCGCVVGEDDIVGNARANNRRVGAIREVVILHTSNQGLTCSVQKNTLSSCKLGAGIATVSWLDHFHMFLP